MQGLQILELANARHEEAITYINRIFPTKVQKEPLEEPRVKRKPFGTKIVKVGNGMPFLVPTSKPQPEKVSMMIKSRIAWKQKQMDRAASLRSEHRMVQYEARVMESLDTKTDETFDQTWITDIKREEKKVEKSIANLRRRQTERCAPYS